MVFRTEEPPKRRGDGAHYLVVIEGEQRGQRFSLGPGPLTVGRREGLEITLPDAGVSKAHCQLRLVDEDLVVTDLGSTNGTFVDGVRISDPATLPVEGHLGVGAHLLKHEFRSRREVAAAQELSGDIQRAASYVQALLPRPLRRGPVRTDWLFVPSSDLGGDAFGYTRLEDDRYAIFLLDVSGHGVGAAMHSMAVFHALRGKSLPVSFDKPANVLDALNRAFQMDQHDGMYFTIWYGVLNVRTRLLEYASAGHPPAVLVDPVAGRVERLRTRNPPIGTISEASFTEASTAIDVGSRLYLFSDGAFELTDPAGSPWSLSRLESLIATGVTPGLSECVRIHSAIAQITGATRWDDDLSLLVVHLAE